MSALQIYTGNDRAPNDPDANTAFHQEIIDRLLLAAREAGWEGAWFHHYYREAGAVCIGISPGEAWPGLEDLRAVQSEIRYRPEVEPEQGSLL